MARIEKQLQGELNSIIRELIKERNLIDKLGFPIIEDERADITIKDLNGNIILFIELKDPTANDGKSTFDFGIIKRETERAKRISDEALKVKYIGISNFLEANFIPIYDLTKVDILKDCLLTEYDFKKLRDKFLIKKDSEIEEKLKRLANWYIDKAIDIIEDKVEQKKSFDDIFIYFIRNLVLKYIYNINETVWKKFNSDNKFKKNIQSYSTEQQWTIPTTEEEIEKIVYISLLLLITKLVFYKALCDYNNEYSNILGRLKPQKKELNEFYEHLWVDFFEKLKVITGDFELLIGDKEDFINKIPFQNNVIIDFIDEIIAAEDFYDFSKINYDIVGRIFEELIREDERHKLGQYFTKSEVVDLINSFCIRKGDEIVLDPSCGSGTFLVRAYERKKELLKNAKKTNEKIHLKLLSEIYGVDISNYATHLSMLNLAIRDLTNPSYPRIIQQDFFDIQYGDKRKIRDVNRKDIDIVFSEIDAIIGNPPYTRQEEIEAFIHNEKAKIEKTLKKDWQEIEIPKRSSIYAYFFFHSGKLIKDKGYLGFITSNSWIDVDYGKSMQEWMLNNFKINTIIDTKVERFFESADVNTNITILQKDENPKNRENNKVKFVYLKKKLTEIIYKFGGVEGLRTFIENTNSVYFDNDINITPIKQKDLWEEAFDKKTNKFIGAKWGKYIRAPKVYWDIMERGKDKWIKLSDIAEVRFGIKTGANEFFYVKDKTEELTDNDTIAIINNIRGLNTIQKIKDRKLRLVQNGLNELWLIDECFLKPVITSPKEISKYIVDEKELKYKVLLINKDKKELKRVYPYTFKYIEWGERLGYNDRPSCNSRINWFDLGVQQKQDFILLRFRDIRNWSPVVEDDIAIGDVVFVGKYYTSNKSYLTFVNAFLNSYFIIIITELYGRINLGDGLLTTYGPELLVIPIIDLNGLEKNSIDKLVNKWNVIKEKKIVLNIFEELGTKNPSDVSLSKVNKDRLELDKAVLEAIGFTDEKEQDSVLLELYRAVVDLVSSRLSKASSVENGKKRKKEAQMHLLINELENHIKENNKNPELSLDFVYYINSIISNITKEKKLQTMIINYYWIKEFNQPLNMISLYVIKLENVIKKDKKMKKANIKNDLNFANYLQDLVKGITDNKKKQNQIVKEYWLKQFSEDFDIKTITEKEQTKLF